MDTMDILKLKGRIKFKLFDPQGQIKQVQEIENVIVTVGKNFLAAWLMATSQSDFFMRYIGLGIGTNAATAADTNLQTPLTIRSAGTLTSNTNVWQNVASFGPGINTGAVTEAAIFSASSGGTMFARQIFPVVNKQAGDTLQVTWQITFA